MSFVYFIQAGGERGAIKIGFSQDVDKRLGQLRTGNPLPMVVLGRFEHENAADVERKLHAEFAEHRLEGEWFAFHDSITELIAAWKLIEIDRGVEHEIPKATQLAMAHVRASSTREALHKVEWWVVEWSESAGDCHVQTLLGTLSMTHNALLFGMHAISDYVIVAICETGDEAELAAELIEPCLKAMRRARHLGLDLNWKWRGGPVTARQPRANIRSTPRVDATPSPMSERVPTEEVVAMLERLAREP